MKCEQAEDLLHGYLDGELDAEGAVEYERHLRGCATCARELDAQHSLRDRLRGAGLYAAAPPSLRRNVRAYLHSPSGVGAAWASRPGRCRWLAAAAAFTVLVIAPWLAFRVTGRGAAEETLASAALDAHLPIAPALAPDRRPLDRCPYRQALVRWKAELLAPCDGPGH
jgi:anti-sigma factor (TIGR02949 family)